MYAPSSVLRLLVVLIAVTSIAWPVSLFAIVHKHNELLRVQHPAQDSNSPKQAAAAHRANSGSPGAPQADRGTPMAVAAGLRDDAAHQGRQPTPAKVLKQPKTIRVQADADQAQAQVERSMGPVDIVYLWVNGSDPDLQQELQQLQQLQSTINSGHPRASDSTSGSSSGPGGRQPLPQHIENPAKQSRFEAGRDELRYSIRALEMHLPWFNHLYIITNRQVPTWLNVSNPKVTVVPHSSIFFNTSHLPTFNTNAINANIINIPGLSDRFITFDDDVFLTAPFSQQDFVAPDGGQHLTGSTLASKEQPGSNMYLHMIKNLDTIFTQRLSPWPRYDPAHAPHYMQKHWLRQLMDVLPDQFQQTSSAHFRTPYDTSLAAAYQWYVSQFQPGTHHNLPDAQFGWAGFKDSTARTFLDAALSDLYAKQEAGDRAALSIAPHSHGKTADFYERAAAAASWAANVAAEGGELGTQLQQKVKNYKHTLQATWSKYGQKVLCFQDDLGDAYVAARQLADPVIKRFMAQRYPRASQFELPEGTSNGCWRRLPQTAYGELPGVEAFAAACGTTQRPQAS